MASIITQNDSERQTAIAADVIQALFAPSVQQTQAQPTGPFYNIWFEQ